MQENRAENLDWLAFRYIAGEVTAAEAESFEQRLAVDSAACEAVARAVELAHAVASVPAGVIALHATRHSQPMTHSTRRRWLRSARWVAAAAVVMLAILGLQSFQKSTDESKLAKVWADVLNSSQTELVADAEDSSADAADELTVPGWMLDAVGSEADSPKWEDS